MSQQARHEPASDPRSPGAGPDNHEAVRAQRVSYPLAQASRLASRFRLAHPVEVHDFPEKGNINQHTFVVCAGTRTPRGTSSSGSTSGCSRARGRSCAR
ncbi:MAG: hypothetical protein M0C28_26235 [Candidatus Moduliflexus flocculans]|nr:hypothetical protein [Candidatus Moduliflexus flocculans]